MAAIFQLDSSLQHRGDPLSGGLDIPVQLNSLADHHEMSAHVLRVDQGFFKLSAPAALPVDAAVSLAMDGCTLQAEVASCEPSLPNKFILGLRRVYGPQRAIRAEPRIPVDLSGLLLSSDGERMFARVVDMSQSGLGFELSASVAVGTRVSVHFVSGIAFGEIRHCSPSKGVFRAGMRILEFVIRHDRNITDSVLWLSRKEPGHRIPKYLMSLAKQAYCSLMGHEYGWFTDNWGRAILRCRRCSRVLSPE